MNKTTYSRVRETLYEETLDNGLKVYLFPKPGFAQVQAMFTTDYGSVDSHFRLSGEADVTHVPDGIAHFLEHKMFESKDEPVFTQFARYGASMNAFTSFSQTSYHFSATDHIDENMRVLLDFVQDPYFTDENVEKEKGIIEQEIRMGEDNPDVTAYYGLLEAMYQKFPLRIKVIGSVESIRQIDKETLYRCYNTFYHPSNMMLCVAGGFEPEPMMDLIRNNQKGKSFGPVSDILREYPQEPAPVAKRETVIKQSVSQPRCLIGWKDKTTGLTGESLQRQDMLTSVILDALFGQSSPFYHQLIDDELIDQHFSWEYEITPHYGYSLVGGNTKDPKQLEERIQSFVNDIATKGLPEEWFGRCQKKMMGWFMTMFDAPGQVTRYFTAYNLRKANVFNLFDALSELTLEDANARLREHFDSVQCSTFIVLPNR